MTDSIYSPEFVQALFNRMSDSYERMNYITSFGFSIRWRWQFLHRLQPTNKNVQVLDLLTGMGETWRAVRRRFPNANLAAIDFSAEMLKKAGLKNQNSFSGAVQLMQQDVLHNTIPDESYDIVICAFGLKTFNEQQLRAFAIETKRILRAGGQFSFIEVSKPTNSLLRWLYGFYLGKVIPILGKLLLGNPSEYKMLWRYTEQFGNAEVACELFRQAGLEVKYLSYFYGCATGFYGRKSAATE